MSQPIDIPHNTRIPAKFSMAITSYGILDYQDFHNKMLWLANFYRETGYQIVFMHFGINRSSLEWKFYVRIYMNDLLEIPPEVGTIIPTLWNIVESVELILLKGKIHE